MVAGAFLSWAFILSSRHGRGEESPAIARLSVRTLKKNETPGAWNQ